MTDWMGLILNRHGQNVVICTTGGEEPVRAFLQPMREKKEQIPGCITDLGYIDERLWTYLGKTEVQPEDRVICNGTVFRVRSSRPYYIGDTLVYWWAGLEAAKEAAE